MAATCRAVDGRWYSALPDCDGTTTQMDIESGTPREIGTGFVRRDSWLVRQFCGEMRKNYRNFLGYQTGMYRTGQPFKWKNIDQKIWEKETFLRNLRMIRKF